MKCEKNIVAESPRPDVLLTATVNLVIQCVSWNLQKWLNNVKGEA